MIKEIYKEGKCANYKQNIRDAWNGQINRKVIIRALKIAFIEPIGFNTKNRKDGKIKTKTVQPNI